MGPVPKKCPQKTRNELFTRNCEMGSLGRLNHKKKRWLSRRQGLEKEAGLRRILSSQQIHIYYNDGLLKCQCAVEFKTKIYLKSTSPQHQKNCFHEKNKIK
jgi:hypothetical protein